MEFVLKLIIKTSFKHFEILDIPLFFPEQTLQTRICIILMQKYFVVKYVTIPTIK